MANVPDNCSTGLDPASLAIGIKGEFMSNTVPTTRPADEGDAWPEPLTSGFLPVKGFTVGSADTFLPTSEVYATGVVVMVHVDDPDIDDGHQYVVPLPLAHALMERLAQVITQEMTM